MKCPSCGAEIEANSIECSYCGTKITVDMKKKQEVLNKAGCPKCNSSNIMFDREKQGEIKGKNGTRVVRKTVGFCKDCGYTWNADGTTNASNTKKKETNWWVIGWIFCFPIPVMILIWRKKNTWPIKVKVAVTAIFWILVLAIGASGESNGADKNEEVAVVDKTNEASSETSSDASENIEISSVADNEKTDDTTGVTVVDIEYDKLQSVFIGLNNSITEDELLSIIADNELEYTAEEYNSTGKTKTVHYKIAYEHDIALQKYADPGDNLEITFSKDDGSLMYVEYFNQASFMNAIYYNYGIYWDFAEKEPNNDYTGYYYHKPGDTKGGITIQYSNGNSSETGYHDVANAEEAIKAVLSSTLQ